MKGAILVICLLLSRVAFAKDSCRNLKNIEITDFLFTFSEEKGLSAQPLDKTKYLGMHVKVEADVAEKIREIKISIRNKSSKECKSKKFLYEPLPLCKKSGGYERWRFYKSPSHPENEEDYGLSILAEDVVVIGNPVISDSSICGQTEIRGEKIVIKRSFIKAWPLGGSQVRLINSDLSSMLIKDSELEASMTIQNSFLDPVSENGDPRYGIEIRGSVFKAKMQMEALISMIRISGSELYGDITLISDYIRKGITITYSKITGKLQFNAVSIHFSEIEGDELLIDNVTVSHSKIKGNDVIGKLEIVGFKNSALGTSSITRAVIEGRGRYHGVFNLGSQYREIINLVNNDLVGRFNAEVDLIETKISDPNLSYFVSIRSMFGERNVILGRFNLDSGSVGSDNVLQNVYVFQGEIGSNNSITAPDGALVEFVDQGKVTNNSMIKHTYSYYNSKIGKEGIIDGAHITGSANISYKRLTGTYFAEIICEINYWGNPQCYGI